MAGDAVLGWAVRDTVQRVHARLYAESVVEKMLGVRAVGSGCCCRRTDDGCSKHLALFIAELVGEHLHGRGSGPLIPRAGCSSPDDPRLMVRILLMGQHDRGAFVVVIEDEVHR